MEQNRIERYPHRGASDLDCGAKLFRGSRMVFSGNGVGTIGHLYTKKTNVPLSLLPHTKIHSAWVVTVNVKP